MKEDMYINNDNVKSYTVRGLDNDSFVVKR